MKYFVYMRALDPQDWFFFSRSRKGVGLFIEQKNSFEIRLTQ